ncbi:MAG: hypothetical protein EOM05_09490 [Clostridia bacterium]|nr:hypothetical protein [Clostridia bacterium]
MKKFLKVSASGIIPALLGTVILWVLTLFNNETRAFLLLKSVNNLALIIVFIILISIIINLISRLSHKSMKLQKIKDSTENYPEKKGFKLYKNFAYYKPDEGIDKLYCKPCLDDRKRERVLQKVSSTTYQCNSCNELVHDFEQRNIAHDEAVQRKREADNGWL